MGRRVAWVVMAGALGTTAPAAAYEAGGYFGFGLGGAIVSGERGVAMKPPSRCGKPPGFRYVWSTSIPCQFFPSSDKELFDELARTDFGDGLAFQLRFGYNILGFVSPELSISGHGNPSGDAGMAHADFILRVHPIQFGIPFQERKYDADVYFGLGYAIGGYHPDPAQQGKVLPPDDEDDAKAWQGLDLTFGGAFHYQVDKHVALGVDLKFYTPSLNNWIVNFDKDFTETPVNTPSTLYFAPTASLLFLL